LIAGVLSFFVSNPKEERKVGRLEGKIDEENIFNRVRNFAKRIKDKFFSFFAFVVNGFRYINGLITKVILPRLSIEQRSKFYSAIRFFQRLKNFIFSYYYYFIYAVGLLIIYHQARLLRKT